MHPYGLHPPNMHMHMAQMGHMQVPVVPIPLAVPAELIPIEGNANFNLNPILASAIASSMYYKDLLTNAEYQTFDAIVKVVETECEHLEPFEAGKSRNPSTAFCCLYRFCVLKLSKKQMQALLAHKSPYVRGVGVLYLRCVAPAKTLFGWFKDHLESPLAFAVGHTEKPQPMGHFLTKLVTENKYYGTVLRRIPGPVVKQFERHAIELQIRRERAQEDLPFMREGTACKAKYTDGAFYDAVIDEMVDKETFLVTYTEYGNQEQIPAWHIQLDPSAFDDPSPDAGNEDEGDRERDGDKHREKRESGREQAEKPRERERDRDRDRDRGSKDREKKKDRGRERESERDRRKDRDRDRGRDRERDRDSRDRRRDKETKEGKEGRERRRDKSASPQRRDSSSSRTKSSSSSSSSSSRSGGSGRSRASARARLASRLPLEEEIERRVRAKGEQEKSNATASGRGDWCRGVTSYKQSLSDIFTGGGTLRRADRKFEISDVDDAKRRRRDRDRSASPAGSGRGSIESQKRQQRKRY